MKRSCPGSTERYEMQPSTSFGVVALRTAHTRRSRVSSKLTSTHSTIWRRRSARAFLALAATLKPEYAEALQAIEVTGTPVKAFAEQKGLSSSNAAVRVFRAREALKKRVIESCGTCAEHGCLNCTCKRA